MFLKIQTLLKNTKEKKENIIGRVWKQKVKEPLKDNQVPITK